jgi:hypothetical protein
MVLESQTDLLEMVLALRPPGGLTGRLNGRQQQRDENADDGNYDQEFHERETGPASFP